MLPHPRHPKFNSPIPEWVYPVLWALSFGPTAAWSSDSIPLDVMFAGSDQVFSGEVIEHKVIQKFPPTPDVSIPATIVIPPLHPESHSPNVRYTVAVKKSWKGEPPDTLFLFAKESPRFQRWAVRDESRFFTILHEGKLYPWLTEPSYSPGKNKDIPASWSDLGAQTVAVVDRLSERLKSESDEYSCSRNVRLLGILTNAPELAVPVLLDAYDVQTEKCQRQIRRLLENRFPDHKEAARFLEEIEADPSLESFLLNEKGWQEPSSRTKLRGLVAEALSSPSKEKRQTIIRSVARLSIPTALKVELLLPALDDPEASVRRAGMSWTVKGARKRSAAIRPFVERSFDLTSDSDPSVRSQAIRFLRTLGDVYPDVLLGALEATRDPDAVVRNSAFQSLHNYSKRVPGVVPRFLEGLKDLDSSVRDTAAYGLISCHTSTWGADSSPAEPWQNGLVVKELHAALGDPSLSVRHTAVGALRMLCPDPEIEKILKETALGDEFQPQMFGAVVAYFAPNPMFTRRHYTPDSTLAPRAKELTRIGLANPKIRGHALAAAARLEESFESIREPLLVGLLENKSVAAGAERGLWYRIRHYGEGEIVLRDLRESRHRQIRELGEVISEKLAREAEIEEKWYETTEVKSQRK